MIVVIQWENSMTLSKNDDKTKNNLEIDLGLSLQESAFLQFINRHGRTILYAILALVALILIMYKMSSSKKSESEADYYYAEIDYDHLKGNVGTHDEEFKDYLSKMKAILERHPELHGKYDAPLAQTLLYANNLAEATAFSAGPFQRTQDEENPFYVDFAKNSLVIGQGEYQKALDNALALNQKMHEQDKNKPATVQHGEILFALNLIRIAALQDQLGHEEKSLSAWQNFENYANSMQQNSQTRELMKRFLDSFSDGKATLTDYIQSKQ